MNKLEALQKKCIKWILDEELRSYSSHEGPYYAKCKELDLLPIKFKLQLKLLHKIINNTSIISLPHYIHFHTGNIRLRSSHLDELSLISNIQPKLSRNYSKRHEITISAQSQFSNSYFYRAINYWNAIPYDIRKLRNISVFEKALRLHLWESARPS